MVRLYPSVVRKTADSVSLIESVLFFGLELSSGSESMVYDKKRQLSDYFAPVRFLDLNQMS